MFSLRTIGTIMAILMLASSIGALSNSGAGSWQYYRDITISNGGSALTDYQVLVNLTGSNFPTNAQSSGVDIRFTDANDAELSYWIENWDYVNRSANVWVNVTGIPSGSVNIRMWYGNPTASSSSNGAITFQFFDDFNDGIINPSLWPTNVGETSPCWYSPSCGTTDHIGATESGGVMIISHSYSNNYKLIKSNAIFNIPFRFGMKIRDSGGINDVYKSAGVGQPTSATYDNGGNNRVNLRRQWNGNFYDTIKDGSIEQNLFSTTMDANTWYTYLFSAAPLQIDFYNGTIHQFQTANIPDSSTPLSIYVKTWTGDNSGSSTISLDYVFLAKYTLPEPSLNIGVEMVIVNVDIKPDTLNKASKSDKNAVTAYIEIPGYDANLIDVNTVILTTSKGSVSAQLKPTEVGDYDNDGKSDRMVKFERQKVINIIDVGDKIKLTIRGKVAGVDFEGSDEIRVIDNK